MCQVDWDDSKKLQALTGPTKMTIRSSSFLVVESLNSKLDIHE